MIRKIALTGGIATGKTYVATRLREAGVPMVDADALAREVVTPGRTLNAIRKRFGPDAVRRDGTMDRCGWRRSSFKDKRARLDSSHHPSRRRQSISDFFAALPSARICSRRHSAGVRDRPREGVRRNRGVACPREMQLQRRWSAQAVEGRWERRLAAQLPIDQRSRSDYVIDNAGTFEQTDAQIAARIEKLNTK